VINVSTPLIRPIGEKATTAFMPHEIVFRRDKDTGSPLALGQLRAGDAISPSLVSAQNRQRCSSVD
jgi:hypothetical protein